MFRPCSRAALKKAGSFLRNHVRAVYAYVNNHFEGFALESAQRLAERLGYELPLPSTEAANSAEDRKQLDLQL